MFTEEQGGLSCIEDLSCDASGGARSRNAEETMPTEVTRRCACGLLLGDVLGTVACSCSSRSVSRALQKYASEQNLVLVDLSFQSDGAFSEAEAITIAGAGAGKIVIPKSQNPLAMAVSPDGRCLAWDNRSARPWAGETGAPLQVFIANTSQPVRSLSPKARWGTHVAISSKAEHIALVAATIHPDPAPWRLIVLNSATGEVEHDLTDLVSAWDLSFADRLSISATGNRLAVGFPRHFFVIDVPTRKVLMEEQGDWPALSPDGESVALVGRGERLVVTNLATGARRTLLRGWWRKTYGVAAWSPDGKYLLAGFAEALRFSVILVAVECESDRYAEVKDLGERAGQAFVWAKRELIQPLPSQRSVPL